VPVECQAESIEVKKKKKKL
jgi:hypothetical protein